MLIKTCTRCKWSDNEFVNCTGFFGNPSADFVFVGEAFGKQEAEAKEAFVGKSGEKLTELLHIASLKRSDVAILNVMRCYLEGNPTPSKSEMDACFIHTARDIKRIKPKMVIALGGSALYALTGKDGVEAHLGKVLWSDKIKCKVYVTYHPAACLYDNKKWDILTGLFRDIKSKADGEVFTVKHYDYLYISSYTELLLQKGKLYSSDKLRVDIETSGVKRSDGLDEYSENSRIALLQIGVDDGTIYLIDGSLLSDNKCIELLKPVLETKKIVGQGFEFDVKFIYVKTGIMVGNFYHDTCLAEYLLTGMKDNDLTYLTYKYVPESGGYDDEVKKAGGANMVKDATKLRQYAADDIGVLYKIERRQRKALMFNGMDWLFDNIIMPCNRVLTRMSLRGIKYDIDELIKIDKEFYEKGADLKDRASKLDGVKRCEYHFNREFNPRSSQMLSWLLLDYYKLPVIKYTKKDAPSIGQDEMEIYSKAPYNNEYCKLMSEYRSIETLRSNFMGGVIPKLVDGVAHTRYSLHATATGRPASYDPNLLNVPSKLKQVKKCLVPRDDCVFIHADLSQIEIRVAAMLSQDPDLVEACNTEGVDFHSMVTSLVHGIPYDEVYSKYKAGDDRMTELRRGCKTISFGILYGMGPPALAYQLGVTEKEAQKFIVEYFKGFPKLKEYMDSLREFVIKNGYVKTYFGFKRTFRNHKAEDHNTIREAGNLPIQGTAWNLMELILIEVDKRLEEEGFKSRLVLQVYDSLVIETYKDELEEVASMVKEIMTTINKPFDILNSVKVKTDIEIGYNLAELKTYDC